MPERKPSPHARRAIRVGVSSCLLGKEVRYDGGHKRDPFITDLLGRYFTWVPVCPEVESGMGIPREAVRLVGDLERPRMVGTRSGKDHTRAMEAFSRARTRDLGKLDLSGYILKARSPSCGMERVAIYPVGPRSERGASRVQKKARGLFARELIRRFPTLPIEEEGRLNDPAIRENFIERVFCYRRWRDLTASGLTAASLVRFHTAHKYLLLSHSPVHYQALGRLVAGAGGGTPSPLASRYGAIFFEALARKATVKGHTNVLRHMAGFFKRALAREEREELAEVIADYHGGLAPLIVPVTLIRHFARKHDVPYLLDQVYLNPHPKELALRNHV